MTFKTTRRTQGRRTTWTTKDASGEVVAFRSLEKGDTSRPVAVKARASRSVPTVRLRTVARSGTGGPRGSVTIVPGQTPSIVAEDVAVKATVATPAGAAHIGQVSLDAAIPAGENVIGRVRIQFAAPTVGAGIATAPAAAAVIADTGALPAGDYMVEVTIGASGSVAAGKDAQIEHRNAANAANLNVLGLCPSSQTLTTRKTRVTLALNERIRVVVGAILFAASEVVNAEIRAHLLPA